MSDHTFPIPGSTALVTGGGSGIGASIARALAGIDCRVVCAGRRLDRASIVANELGHNGIALQLDVTDDQSVSSLEQRLPPDWRDIDILVNNAGHDVGGRRRFDTGATDQWASIIDTNVTGLIRITRKVIEGMVERDHGDIINIGSTSGMSSYAGGTLYSSSKHAVHGFTQSLRKDFNHTGIRVTEIMPGMVRTEFAETRFEDTERGQKFYDDYGVCLNPEDVARAVVFTLQQPPHVNISQLVIEPRSET